MLGCCLIYLSIGLPGELNKGIYDEACRAMYALGDEAGVLKYTTAAMPFLSLLDVSSIFRKKNNNYF